PLWVRRVVTMVPTIVVIALGVNTTAALVISQVVLSLVLPVPVVTLLAFTNRREIMGELANARAVTVIAVVAAAIIIMLNTALLWQILGLPLPWHGA
ncbi:MAG: divalent metal cation transporter, partial [Candidatus Eremiobacteraeota bacterium]|nr:divalent metal cation transporter [Candidatus Eremiobacteraeota bacterium]